MLRQLGFLGLILVGHVPQLLSSQTRRDTVPFIGCPADGQQGAIDPPPGPPKGISIGTVPSPGLAYYKGGDSAGVYAPPRCGCKVGYGVSGSVRCVTPEPMPGR